MGKTKKILVAFVVAIRTRMNCNAELKSWNPNFKFATKKWRNWRSPWRN